MVSGTRKGSVLVYSPGSVLFRAEHQLPLTGVRAKGQMSREG